MAERHGLEQVRERVLQAARDIERLCDSGAPPEAIFPVFLQRLSSSVAAQAAAVWMLDPGRRLTIAYDAESSRFGLDDHPGTHAWRRQLIGNTIATGESTIETAPQHEGASTRPTLVAIALYRGTDCVGAVELGFRNELRPEARTSLIPFLEQMCGYASRVLGRTVASTASAWTSFLEAFEEQSLALHGTLDPLRVAMIAANDGRALLGCQRVSVAVQRGRRLRVRAISGQDGIERKSGLVRAMTALAQAVCAMREPLYFQGQTDSLLPSLQEPLTRYLEESGTQTIALLPLLEPAPPSDDEPDARRNKPRTRPRRVVGCLIVDGPVDAAITARSRDAIALLADHTAAALANAAAYHRVFLLPLWRLLGERWDRVRGSRLLVALLLMAALGGAIAGLVVVPWSYRVPAEGRLMPVQQREVFAPWEGDVIDVVVRDGQRVAAGDLLVRMRSDDLHAHLLSTRTEWSKKQESLIAIQAQIDDATKKADRDEETRLQGELAATRIEVDGLEKQLRLWEQREAQLTVVAPMDGVVVTFRVEQSLRNRPVRRGEVLLELMQDEGDWQLELNVPEHRMGHLLQAQRTLSDPHRPVEFVLATLPEQTFTGTLQSLATRAAQSEKHGAVVEAYAMVDARRLPVRTIGAEVEARIDCGTRSLGYVLFGDFIEWIRRKLWL